MPGEPTLKKYLVSLDLRATLTQPSQTVIVVYFAPDYHEAWVGARVVCRLGTLFEQDSKYREGGVTRKFFNEDGDPFPVNPGVYTVRRIFVSDTRKTGKQRMSNLKWADIEALLQKRGIELSTQLGETLRELIGNSEGLRITSATARRLGLIGENEELASEE